MTIATLITTLLAVAAVYVSLWITGTEFNITSRMGMTMIVGFVTEVAIFSFRQTTLEGPRLAAVLFVRIPGFAGPRGPVCDCMDQLNAANRHLKQAHLVLH